MTSQQAKAIQAALDADFVLDTIQENFLPEDVFSKEQLTEWAEENGFVKKTVE